MFLLYSHWNARTFNIPYDTLSVSPFDMYIQEVEITNAELL